MRILSISLISIGLLMAGCQPKKTTTDFETISKDSTFRAGIKTGAFIKLSQGYTYYEWSNPQADTVLVLVHGFSVPSYIWDSTFYAASKRGYSIVRYDNYGRGFSDNPDAVYDVELFTNQLHELLDSLKISTPITLVGLSDGGRAISSFAAQFPARVKNLVYVDAVSFENPVDNPQHPAAVTEKEIEEFKSSDNYPKMGKGQLSDFYDSIPFRGWDKKYEDIMKFKGFARAIISTRKNRTPLVDEHQKIAAANLPVFAIWGEHDTVVVLDDVRGNLTTRFPSAKLFVIPKAGHLPHMEQAKLFNDILLDQIIRGK
jgi:pimeloyl-ACP methyl ester carboxylesterase